MKRAVALLLIAAAVIATAEPTYQGISPSQTVGSISFPRWTRSVVVVSLSSSANTCYMRLFTDVDTAGNATTSNWPIAPGESFPFRLYPCDTSQDLQSCRDSESINASGRRASYYSSLSYICSSGQSATWRVYSK
jgi:hypothetical protein